MTAARSAFARTRLVACNAVRACDTFLSQNSHKTISIAAHSFGKQVGCRRIRTSCSGSSVLRGLCNCNRTVSGQVIRVNPRALSNIGQGSVEVKESAGTLSRSTQNYLFSQGLLSGGLRTHHCCSATGAAIVDEQTEDSREAIKDSNVSRDSSSLLSEEASSTLKMQVVVRDEKELERKKQAIRAAGPIKLQVIADFDMTLTRFSVNGKKGQSCHSLLAQKNNQYNQMRQELYKYYYPLEIDQSIPYDKKVKLMEEWYEKSHATLLDGGLTLDEIRESVAKANVAFREETAQLFELLDSKRVPVLIFSAGLADVLEEILRQKLHRSFGNIRVVSNRMKFDEAGRLQSFVGSLIHSLNKNEHAIALAGPMHDEQGRPLDDLEHSEPSTGASEPAIDGLDGRSVVAGRNNVVLLGDHLGDLGMSRGVDVEEQISIAFLNDKVEENLQVFVDSFDVVLLGDGSMKEVISIVQDIL